MTIRLWIQHHRWFTIFSVIVVVLGATGTICWYEFFRTVSSPITLGNALRLYRLELGAHPNLRRGVFESGVFSYSTTGNESLNLPGLARPFPTRTNMVVTTNASGSCSSVDWVPLVQHTETTTVCRSTAGSLALSKLVFDETIGGSSSTSVTECPATAYLIPPIAVPGVHWKAMCRQVNPAEPISLAGSILGAGPIDIGGTKVETIRVRLLFTFKGPDQGVSPVIFWISTKQGLVVRESETALINQGPVVYRELMNSRLRSVRPAA